MSEGPLSVLDVDMAGKVCGCVVVEESSYANVRLEAGDSPSRLCSDKYTPGVRCLKVTALVFRNFHFTFVFPLMRTLQRPPETGLTV